MTTRLKSLVALSCLAVAACAGDPEPGEPTYAVGGELLGLEGSGLVLKLKDESLALAADGKFTFTTRLKAGETFEVTVAAQPTSPSQTCTLNSTSGRIELADFLELRVSCGLNDFRVGGTVTGLVGALKLEMNGATLDVTEDGPFVFENTVPDGKPYFLSIKESPAAQQCLIEGGNGTMNGADVTDIAITCANVHSLGGTLSGASGPVTLQYNATEITVPDNGPFVLAPRVVAGSGYNVVVQTSPSGQACTVANGQGTVQADVANIAVTCKDLYAVSATLTGTSGPISVTLNGQSMMVDVDPTFTFQNKVADGDAYDVQVTMPALHQRCVVKNATGTIAAADVTNVEIKCARWYAFDTFQAASFVLGHTNFVGTAAVSDAASFTSSWGAPAVAGGYLFLPLYDDHRVFAFSNAPTANGEAALLVLGQDNFSTKAAATSKAGMRKPQSVATDGTRLLVGDFGNSRVLVYNTIPGASGTEPDGVIGQADFDTVATDCSATRLHSPERIFVFGGRLFVADSGHNRVLIWNGIPATPDTPADLVLGQQALDTCTQNDADGDGQEDATPSASTLRYPTDVWTDGERFAVVDSENRRILLWNSFPTQHGQPADLVLGQPDMTSAATGTSATRFESGLSFVSTGLQIMVSDYLASRVLVWNSFPTEDDQPADIVLGQPDLNSDVSYNDGAGASDISAKGLSGPVGLLLHDGRLWVVDTDTNRLLGFDSLE